MNNRIAQWSVGFLHLGIGLIFLNFLSLLDFSAGFESFFNSVSDFFNFGNQGIQRFVLVILISLSSISVFVQSLINVKPTQYANYVFSGLIILLLASNVYFFIEGESLYYNKIESLIQASLGHLYFALLIILITFSPILYSNKQEDTVVNNSLDSDFLENDTSEENQNSSYFWRMHRIFSISLGFVCLLSGIMAFYQPTTPTYITFILFFGLSILLWYQAKLGSFVTSIFSILMMILGFSVIILTKDLEEVKQLYNTFTIIVLGLFFISFMGSIPFILLNKEVRKEWKMK
ncbi:hypothetical protein ACE193_08590 [Bernardetia sp. OM2101]|uniref:hypothetical protein n=1 Tax=Bernardetia sp. OM2101 TaxID=3344876 RepID=UPI0035CFDBE3